DCRAAVTPGGRPCRKASSGYVYKRFDSCPRRAYHRKRASCGGGKLAAPSFVLPRQYQIEAWSSMLLRTWIKFLGTYLAMVLWLAAFLTVMRSVFG
ncbi:MAG: hypothetical protein V3U63_10550, partial [Gemmatimonadota bacterium]